MFEYIVLALILIMGLLIYLIKDNVYSAFILALLSIFIGILYIVNGLSVGFILIVLAYVVAVVSLIIVTASTFERGSPYFSGARLVTIVPIITLFIAIIIFIISHYAATTIPPMVLKPLEMLNEFIISKWGFHILLIIAFTLISMLVSIQLSRKGEIA